MLAIPCRTSFGGKEPLIYSKIAGEGLLAFAKTKSPLNYIAQEYPSVLPGRQELTSQ